ncbi:MAG: HD domain-containing protein [Bacillota bacterium]|nr:HD domain-containing protein [Bacillota bacterium]
MKYIHSKDIFLLMRDTLKMIDRRAMDHGSRVAYYLYKMLECRGGYEKFELADLVFLASLHDIGAYKTENLKNLIGYECREPMPHATYGYLVFKHLSPIRELAAVILYHHTDYSQLEKLNYEYKDIAAFLNLAEKVDIFSGAMKDSFDMGLFRRQSGTVFSPEAVELFEKAVQTYDILNKVNSGEYKAELLEIVDYMIFNNEDKKKFLEMLMYCQGFKSEKAVVDTVTCICISEILGQKMHLSELELEQLYYGSLLHDIGMLAIPREIIEAPRKLTADEYEKVKMHVHLGEKMLNNRMAEEIVKIVAAHHERCDGSGYPRRLRGTQMNHSQEIIQLADTVTALWGQRAYRAPFDKKEVLSLIRTEADGGKYSKAAVKIFLDSYDEIMEKVKKRSDEIMVTYRKLNQQYNQVSGRLKEE